MGSAKVEDLPLLTAARVVTRCFFPNDELPHIARLLDSFLDNFSSKWTLARGYKRTGSLQLLQYIAARQPASALDPFYRRWMLNATAWFIGIQGDLPALRWLMETNFPNERLGAAVYAAAANDHVEILKWLYENHHDRVYWNCIEMCGALDYGHEDAFEWLRTHSPPRPECLKLVMRSAAKSGNLPAVRWLYNNCHAHAEDALVHAQKEGHWETARWILVNCDLTVRRIQWDGAAASGALSFLKYAYSRDLGNPLTSALIAAACNGHLNVMKLLHFEVGIPLTGAVMRRAAENGHLDIVEWVHEIGCEPANAWVMDTAAANGHLNVVQWLHANRNDGCTSKAMSWAAGHGYLDVVKWLHSNRTEGCTTLGMDLAAANGWLDIVQWLHEARTEGCTTDAMDGAAREGHLEVVQWLDSHRNEGCTTAAMDSAASGGHLDIVKWLHNNRSEGCTTSAMDWAASNGHLEVVQWLHANRTEGCTVDAMTSAAVKGHIDIIKWLHRYRNEGCASNTMSKAVATGNLEIVAWIFESQHEISAHHAMKEAILRARFEVVMYLHTKGVGVLSFSTDTIFHRPSWELVQWLVTNHSEQVLGCRFEVPTWDYRLNDWCRHSRMQRTSRDENFTVWRYDGI
ncbi:unnamed protein product [Phytophthora lilii]|uniref:Unnamed protein product n=1 Tax=Phytophthora lilii TaxID=2077276 RepID=A0A9W6YJX2_9STRA|nr:unnamed protein product [Phytophthora lilii]